MILLERRVYKKNRSKMQHVVKPSAINALATQVTPNNHYYTNSADTIRQLSMTEEYSNYFTFDVVIIDLNNNRVKLKALPENVRIKKELTIRRHYKWDNAKVLFDVNGLYCDKSKDDKKALPTTNYQDAFLKMLVDEHGRFLGNPNLGYIMGGTVLITLTEATLRKYGGAVFIKELGIVIATPANAPYVINPLSVEAQIATKTDNNTTPFVYRIFANDPTGVEYNARYVNINGEVYKVPVHKDPTLTAGVYVTRGEPPVGVEYTDNELNLIRYDFDVADTQLNLYKNPQDAKDHFGFETARQEREIKELTERLNKQQLENKIRLDEMQIEFTRQKNEQELEFKAQINAYKTEIEKLKAEADARTAVLKAESDHYESVSMARKDSYDSRSHSRKDWSEYVKWIPGFIGGAVAAIGFAFALFL